MYRQIIIIFTLFLWIPTFLLGQITDVDKSDCNGLYKGQKKPAHEEFEHILLNHSTWLQKYNKDTYTDSARSDKLRANFCDANLKKIDISNDSLGRADFDYANLDSAVFHKASLWGIDMSYAKITNAMGWLANLKGAHGVQVNLTNSSFLYSDLRNIQLFQGIVKNANFQEADLSEASLFEANFEGSQFINTNLKGALMGGVDFKNVIYEVKENSYPQIERLGSAKNMNLMTFQNSPKALMQLREELAKAGMNQQERELTYAIRHSQRLKKNFAERWFEFALFESTCGYGLYPWRPLKLLLINIPLFSIIYFIGLYTRKRTASIWKVYPEDSLVKKSELAFPLNLIRHKWNQKLFYGVYFSILSAFNIGFRDFNIGEWITRVQTEEYKLKANGWIRVVSGIQSIISIYLLAMWALTYFGKPFN